MSYIFVRFSVKNLHIGEKFFIRLHDLILGPEIVAKLLSRVERLKFQDYPMS